MKRYEYKNIENVKLESVADFSARGGQVTKCRPKLAPKKRKKVNLK